MLNNNNIFYRVFWYTNYNIENVEIDIDYILSNYNILNIRFYDIKTSNFDLKVEEYFIPEDFNIDKMVGEFFMRLSKYGTQPFESYPEKLLYCFEIFIDKNTRFLSIIYKKLNYELSGL